MYCQNCGKELPSGASNCPACGAAVSSWPVPPSPDLLDQMVSEAKRAAKDLIVATGRISRYAAKEAKAASKDPSGSAKKVAKRVASELEHAASEVERLVRDL